MASAFLAICVVDSSLCAENRGLRLDMVSEAWRFLDPGFGLNVAVLAFDDQTYQVGLGAHVTIFGDLLLGGYGYNLNARTKNWYVYVGIGLLELVEAVPRRLPRLLGTDTSRTWAVCPDVTGHCGWPNDLEVTGMGPDVIASIAAVLVSLLGALIAALSKRLLTLRVGPIELDIPLTQHPEEDSRLMEARRAERRQGAIAKWTGLSNALLTFGQYIVGALLASSFVQASLTQEIVGSLGVLVLVSSAVHQRYRPDLQATGARQRGTKLRALIRDVEDDLYDLKQGRQGAPSVYEVRRKVTRDSAKLRRAKWATQPGPLCSSNATTCARHLQFRVGCSPDSPIQ